MCFGFLKCVWILTEKGTVMARRPVQSLKEADKSIDEARFDVNDFDKCTSLRIGETLTD